MFRKKKVKQPWLKIRKRKEKYKSSYMERTLFCLENEVVEAELRITLSGNDWYKFRESELYRALKAAFRSDEDLEA